MTLLDLAAAAPDAPAPDDGERRHTRAQLVDRATRAGRMLRTAGVAPGGTVALLLGNRVELVEMATAAVLSGARFTAVNWHLTADEVRYVLTDSGAGLVVTEPAFAAVATEAAAGLGIDVVHVGDELDAALADQSDEPFALGGLPGGRCSTPRAPLGGRRGWCAPPGRRSPTSSGRWPRSVGAWASTAAARTW